MLLLIHVLIPVELCTNIKIQTHESHKCFRSVTALKPMLTSVYDLCDIKEKTSVPEMHDIWEYTSAILSWKCTHVMGLQHQRWFHQWFVRLCWARPVYRISAFFIRIYGVQDPQTTPLPIWTSFCCEIILSEFAWCIYPYSPEPMPLK